MPNVADTTVTTSHFQVRLDGIDVMAKIGTSADEQGNAQPLRIFVALNIFTPQSDSLEATFDYSHIHAFAHELAMQKMTLIETFALRLANLCMANPVVFAAHVRIEKPKAVPPCIAGVSVQLTRSS